MSEIKHVLSHKAYRVWQYVYSFLKWVLIASLTGAVGGGIGGAFRFCVDFATDVRSDRDFMIYLLPVGGLVIAMLYRATKLNGVGNTNLIINSIRTDDKLPITLAPVVFVSTIITHLFGGSAGREGAALQLGGCIGSQVGRIFKLDEKDLHICVLCGMSGFFSALFGTPLTAALFAMEVISIGVIYYSSFVPCMVSALVAFGITRLLGQKPVSFELSSVPQMNIRSVSMVALLGVGCAVVGILFCLALKWTHKFAAKFFKNEYLRVIIGGALIIGLTLLVGERRYNGAGADVIAAAFSGADIRWYDFLLKILFTAITIGFGYKGGEIIPTIFIGASFGYIAGGVLGLDPTFGAAVGVIALFCAVVNCPVASLALSAEMFHTNAVVLFAVAVCISFMLSGYYGLYSGQKIVYSKRRAVYINKNTK